MINEIELTPAQLLGIRKVKQIQSDNDVTLELIEQAYRTSAYLVKNYGDKYLPLFERIDSELERKKAHIRLKQRALEITEESEW